MSTNSWLNRWASWLASFITSRCPPAVRGGKSFGSVRDTVFEGRVRLSRKESPTRRDPAAEPPPVGLAGFADGHAILLKNLCRPSLRHLKECKQEVFGSYVFEAPGLLLLSRARACCAGGD